MSYCGSSTGFKPGSQSHVEYNHISYTCWGAIQHDGANIQVTMSNQDGTVVDHNWLHGGPKNGIRFDGSPNKYGRNGIIKYNVVYQCDGINGKGDYQTYENNLVFDSEHEY